VYRASRRFFFAGGVTPPRPAVGTTALRFSAKPKHFDDLTPAEQSAFKMKLDHKFRPIPAIVAKAAQARAELNL
jgi:hypothetical protein